MNGNQLFTFLTLDPYAGPLLKGMAMSDSVSLKNINHSRALYVLNTDVENGKGEHWCMKYFDNGLCEFFDPFGMPPETYGFEQLIRLRKNIKQRIFNRICVQHPESKACGAHCLFYGYHKGRGQDLKDIMAHYYSADLKKNDQMVENFVKSFG